MTSTSRLPDGSRSFAAAAAIAAMACLALLAAAVALPWEPFLWFPILAPSSAVELIGGLLLVGLAGALAGRSEGLAYALLVAACLEASRFADPWAPTAIWYASPDLPGQGALTGHGALALLALPLYGYAGTPATAAILTLFAAAPERRLARWVGRACWTLTGLAAAWALLRGAVAMGLWNGEASGPWIPGWWAVSLAGHGIAVAVPLTLGIAGSVRAAGRRHLATGRRGSVGIPVAAGGSAAFSVLVYVAFAACWTGVMYPLGGQGTGGVPALFALAVAVLVVRWSRALGWAALAVSLQWSAAPAFSTADLLGLSSVDAVHQLGAPQSVPGWWPAMLIGLGLLGLAASAAWAAFGATDPPFPGRRWRVAAVAVTVGAPVAAIATGGALWAPIAIATGLDFEVLLLPAFIAIPLLAGAVVLLGRRIVPAAAEAELVAGDPFRPGRYFPALVQELLTGRAQAQSLGAEAERIRLASDLHADVLPSISRLLVASRAGGPPEQVEDHIRAVEDEVRGLLAERRFVVLDEFGIVEALEWLVGRTEQRVAFPIDLAIDERSTDDRPPLPVERAAFRIANLAVENSITHARPSRLTINLLVRADRLRVEVTDDGVGAEPGDRATAAKSNHQGIADMTLQAQQVQAKLEIGSPPTGGTTVAFTWSAR